ncbi:MAG: hypothetical protein AUJ56_07595 [Zetaproteobacteria bacterium CG1_02_49_23]|nr:MAG: hypothetical protein AUJ56_07595 [Zetaproteobacteria bacterium CG1_02_49_23]
MNSEKMHAYMALVLRFRKVLNLTSVSDAAIFKRRFIDPTALMSEYIPDTGRMLDIGSGMGVPGIPLLILKSGVHGVLVERRKKRAEFLRHVVRELGLSAEVHDASVEDLPCMHVDICVARAVTRVNVLLDMCSMHTNRGATAVFPVPINEVPAVSAGWTFKESFIANAGSEQRIQIYKWEDVSRET